MRTNPTLLVNEWKQLIIETKLKLQSISDEESCLKPLPEKWSGKEVLGHLCDSCLNNYLRIMNLLITKGDCILQSYAQNEWVMNAAYQNRKWDEIIELWYQTNQSFIRLVSNAPADAWSYEGIYKTERQSFEFLVTDYIAHLKHHFTQIFIN